MMYAVFKGEPNLPFCTYEEAGEYLDGELTEEQYYFWQDEEKAKYPNRSLHDLAWS